MRVDRQADRQHACQALHQQVPEFVHHDEAQPVSAARCDGALYAAAALHLAATGIDNLAQLAAREAGDTYEIRNTVDQRAPPAPARRSVAAGDAGAHLGRECGQDKIVKAYLEAAASGQPEAVLEFLHPGELEDLRNSLIKTLEDEAAHGSSTVRERLFGASTIDDIRHLTPNSFFVSVARRLGLPAERIGEISVLGIIDENSQLSHAVARIAPPVNSDLHGRVALVSLVRYGKDWRVAIPYSFQSRLDAATAAPTARPAAGQNLEYPRNSGVSRRRIGHAAQAAIARDSSTTA